MSQENVGLIGVGLLGKSIADRLLSSGRQVWGYDLRGEPLEALVKAGGKRCESPQTLFRECPVIVLSLPDSRVSTDVLAANTAALRAGQTIIDTTTGRPEEMIEIGKMLWARKIAYIEATVAGSSQQVSAGTACLFLGGEEANLRRVEQLLAAVTSTRFHMGPVGSASRFKLVHNLVLGLNRAALAEGFSFAEALGLDPAQVLEILQQTPAASKVMETKGPKMVQGDFEPQARLSQHLKDVRLIIAAAAQKGLEIPLSQVHRQLLERAEQLGFGDADNSAVIQVYRLRSEEAV